MPRVRMVGLLAAIAGLVLIAQVGALRGTAQTPAPSTATPAATSAAMPSVPSIQLPVIPDPVAVRLDASKTAFLVLDLVDRICQPNPRCVAVLPNVAAGLQAARAAGVMVVYTTSRGAAVMPDVAPMQGDPMIDARADKFDDSNLDDILNQAGITTVVITGSGLTGAVLYTPYEAAERGMTVVVASDGIVGNSDFVDLYGRYQLLNMSGATNPQNTPLKASAATLSRLDLITYK